jgi:hypothetical protein
MTSKGGRAATHFECAFNLPGTLRPSSGSGKGLRDRTVVCVSEESANMPHLRDAATQAHDYAAFLLIQQGQKVLPD